MYQHTVRYAHLLRYKRQCNVKAGQLKLAKIHNHHTGYENLEIALMLTGIVR